MKKSNYILIILYFLILFISNNYQSDYLANFAKEKIGKWVGDLGNSLQGKNNTYNEGNINNIQYEPNVDSSDKNALNNILKDYMIMYNDSISKDNINISDLTNKIKFIILKRKGFLNQFENILNKKNIQLICQKIEFWINDSLKDKQNNYDANKYKNALSPLDVKNFLETQNSLKNMFYENFFNLLKKDIIQNKSDNFINYYIFNNSDFNYIKSIYNEVNQYKELIYNIIKENIINSEDFNNMIKKSDEIVDQLKKGIEEINKEIGQIEDELIKKESDFIKKKELREKYIKELISYEKEIKQHEMSFDTTHLQEEIDKIKKNIEEESLLLNKFNNKDSSKMKQILNFFSKSEDIKIKEKITKLEEELIKKAFVKKEIEDQKNREYNLFMPKENTEKIAKINEEIELEENNISSTNKEKKDLNEKIKLVNKRIEDINIIKEHIANIITMIVNILTQKVEIAELVLNKNKNKSKNNNKENILVKSSKIQYLSNLIIQKKNNLFFKKDNSGIEIDKKKLNNVEIENIKSIIQEINKIDLLINRDEYYKNIYNDFIIKIKNFIELNYDERLIVESLLMKDYQLLKNNEFLNKKNEISDESKKDIIFSSYESLSNILFFHLIENKENKDLFKKEEKLKPINDSIKGINTKMNEITRYIDKVSYFFNTFLILHSQNIFIKIKFNNESSKGFFMKMKEKLLNYFKSLSLF